MEANPSIIITNAKLVINRGKTARKAISWWTLNVATFNINQGCVFIRAILLLFEELQVDVFALQEANIPHERHISWIARWKALGFHGVLCSAADGASSAALVSCFPCKEMITAEVLDSC